MLPNRRDDQARQRLEASDSVPVTGRSRRAWTSRKTPPRTSARRGIPPPCLDRLGSGRGRPSIESALPSGPQPASSNSTGLLSVRSLARVPKRAVWHSLGSDCPTPSITPDRGAWHPLGGTIPVAHPRPTLWHSHPCTGISLPSLHLVAPRERRTENKLVKGRGFSPRRARIRRIHQERLPRRPADARQAPRAAPCARAGSPRLFAAS